MLKYLLATFVMVFSFESHGSASSQDQLGNGPQPSALEKNSAPGRSSPADLCDIKVAEHNKIVQEALDTLDPYTSRLLGELYTLATFHLSEKEAPLTYNLARRYTHLYAEITSTPGLTTPNGAHTFALERTRKRLRAALESILEKMDLFDAHNWRFLSLKALPDSEKNDPQRKPLLNKYVASYLKSMPSNVFDAILAFGGENKDSPAFLDDLYDAYSDIFFKAGDIDKSIKVLNTINPLSYLWSNARVFQGHVILERCVSLGSPNGEDLRWIHGCVSFDLVSKATMGYPALAALNHPKAIFENIDHDMPYEPQLLAESGLQYLRDSYDSLKNKCGKSAFFSKALPVSSPNDFTESQRKEYAPGAESSPDVIVPQKAQKK